jgi:hypothetical protein
LSDFPITLTFKRQDPVAEVKDYTVKYETYLEGYYLNSIQVEVLSIPTGIIKYKLIEILDFSIHPLMGGTTSEALDLPTEFTT